MLILSNGGGVDSFGAMVAIEQGLIEKPDLIIFADTQGESEETYQHIEQYQKPLAARLGIPWVTISRGNLFAETLAKSMTPKTPYCSWMYKRDIINKYIKENGLGTADEPARVMINIGLEEWNRGFKPSAVKWVENEYPLLEAKLSRSDLTHMIAQAGYPVPPKSGCWFCPWRNKKYWLSLKQKAPAKYDKAVGMEKIAGRQISNSRFWLKDLEAQQTFDLALLEQEQDNNCTSGYCETF